MAKNTRGKGVKRTPNWRGTCPNCNRQGVKLLWTDENEQQVCKICGNE